MFAVMYVTIANKIKLHTRKG